MPVILLRPDPWRDDNPEISQILVAFLLAAQGVREAEFGKVRFLAVGRWNDVISKLGVRAIGA
jgi:hypothetical protein